MRIRTQQSGFAILELVLVVAVLGAAGLTAWFVYQRQSVLAPSSSSGTTPVVATNISPTATVASAPQVSTATDLNAALQALDQNDPTVGNANDLSQLGSQTSDL